MAQKFVVTEVSTVDGIFTNAHQRVMSLNEAVQSTPGVGRARDLKYGVMDQQDLSIGRLSRNRQRVPDVVLTDGRRDDKEGFSD